MSNFDSDIFKKIVTEHTTYITDGVSNKKGAIGTDKNLGLCVNLGSVIVNCQGTVRSVNDVSLNIIGFVSSTGFSLIDTLLISMTGFESNIYKSLDNDTFFILCRTDSPEWVVVHLDDASVNKMTTDDILGRINNGEIVPVVDRSEKSCSNMVDPYTISFEDLDGDIWSRCRVSKRWGWGSSVTNKFETDYYTLASASDRYNLPTYITFNGCEYSLDEIDALFTKWDAQHS